MQFRKFAGLLAAIGVALSMSACATVTRGQNDAWEVNSDPSGAKVETSNGHQCPSTPCSIRMSRKSEFTATVTKEGYKTATVTVTHKTTGAGAAGVAGNVLVGGIIGIGVDAVTGASQDLTPNPANVKLEKIELATPSSRPTGPPVSDSAAATPAKKDCGVRSVSNPDAVSC